MGSLVVGLAGAVVGSFFGAPQIGFMVGSVAGGILFPQPSPPPHINDIRIQNSAYGQHITWPYGMYRLSGNIIWAGQPVQSEQGGKGGGGKGGGQPVVNMSFAVGICEGPITGVRRIWANGKLIYDVSNPSNFEALSGSAQMVTNFTVYPGDENQLPDPTMEAALGVGNVPAHRGLAYVVFNGLDLSPWGNFLPSFSFEVATQQQPTYSSSSAVAWNDPNTGADYFRTPHMTAAGGTALGYKASGGSLFQAVSMNAYTATASPTPSPSVYPGNLSGIAYGTSDVPGFMAQAVINWAWYNPDGTFMDAGPYNSGSIGAAECSFVKVGGYIYSTNNYGGGNNPVTKSQFGSLTGTGYPAGTAGITIAQSTVLKPFVMVGVTSSYVYAMDTAANVLYQFDVNSLAVTNSWASPPGIPLGALGYAINDGQIYIYNGGTLLRFDATHGVWKTLGAFSIPFQGTSMYAVNDDFFVFAGDAPYTTAMCFAAAAFPAGPTNGVLLSAIVADICNRAGLSGAQYDVSQLTDLVYGYAVTQHMTPRDALTPLMQAYFFDVSDTDGKLKFVKRGAQPAQTIPWADLGAATSESDQFYQNPIVETVMQEVDLPRTLTLSYVGYQNDYQEGSQQAFRTVTASNKDSKMQMAIVMADDDALQRAQQLLWSTWMARRSFEFKTGLKYLNLEPTDVVTLTAQDGSTITTRMLSCQWDGMGSLSWHAVAEYPGLYGSSTAAGGSTSVGMSKDKVAYSGPTDLIVMDIPPLRPQDASAAGLYTAACGYASDWPGCQVEVSRDGSAFTGVETLTNAAAVGVTTSALPNFLGGNQPDELSTLTVQMVNGTLSTVSYSDFLAGVQAAYVGGELVYFRSAVLVSGSTYRLTGFLRGLLGTDRLMAAHGSSEAFVLLDATKLKRAGINTNDLKTKLYFDAYLLNQLGPVSPTQVTLTPQDGGIRPLHPVLFAAAHGNAGGASDISLQWVRQARINYAWSDGTDVPLDQSSESYLLTISDASGNVKRQVTVLGPFTSPVLPNYDYTSAQITADGFSTGNTINFAVAQNSDQGVLGWPATTSIVR